MPQGFKCAGIAAGIKNSGAKDMALIVSDAPASAAGVFTTNQVCAAPVKVCRAHLKGGIGRAIVMNSGIANACTGQAGILAAREMCAATAGLLGCKTEEVFVCSTGRIGPQLPLEVILPAIERLVREADEIQIDGKPVSIVGLAKGAGMIEPNMATMLSFVTTDAAVEQAALQAVLKTAVAESFNRISVDGDQSTNDTVLCLANSAAGNRPLNRHSRDWDHFSRALEEVCFELAMMIVRDGEGATRFVTVNVSGAATAEEADFAARAVANSLLNKTAWAGEYPNWGRVMDAIGYSRARVLEERVEIAYDDQVVVSGGTRTDIPQENLVKVVSQECFNINIELNLGEGSATVYTCNCTEEYVRINVT